MKNKIIMILAAVIFYHGLTYGQRLSLAGVQNQVGYEIAVNPAADKDAITYSAYNFVHFDQLNNNASDISSHFIYRGDHSKPHIGPAMMAVGIIMVVVGAIGMEYSKTGNLNGNSNSGRMDNWKGYNTYSDVALADGGVFTTGLIVALACGDLRGGNNGSMGVTSYGGHSFWRWGGHEHRERHKQWKGGKKWH